METRTIQATFCDKYLTVKLREGCICNKNDQIFDIIGMGDTEIESIQEAFDNVCDAYETCLESIDIIIEDMLDFEGFEIDEEFISRSQEIAEHENLNLKYKGFGSCQKNTFNENEYESEGYPKKKFVIIYKVDAGHYTLAVE